MFGLLALVCAVAVMPITTAPTDVNLLLATLAAGWVLAITGLTFCVRSLRRPRRSRPAVRLGWLGIGACVLAVLALAPFTVLILLFVPMALAGPV